MQGSSVINGQDPSWYTTPYVQDLADRHHVIGSVVNIGVYNPWTLMCRTPGEALRIAGKWFSLVRKNPGTLRIARSTDDLERARADGATCLILAFQGLDPIDFSVDMADVFHAIGIRVMQLTYNEANRLGDGCAEHRDGGLTSEGRQFVERIGELGIVLDLSHAGDRTSLEAIELSPSIPVFSHANARALVDTRRNISDAQIKAIAERDGVIGISMFPPLLAQGRDARLEDVADHVCYLADLVGPRHVGLGLDFPHNVGVDHWVRLQAELNLDMDLSRDPRQGMQGLPQLDRLFELLGQRGLTDADLDGIASGHFLRVFSAVWAADSAPTQ